jgi:hypothetical protein
VSCSSLTHRASMCQRALCGRPLLLAGSARMRRPCPAGAVLLTSTWIAFEGTYGSASVQWTPSIGTRRCSPCSTYSRGAEPDHRTLSTAPMQCERVLGRLGKYSYFKLTISSHVICKSSAIFHARTPLPETHSSAGGQTRRNTDVLISKRYPVIRSAGTVSVQPAWAC